jgi:rhomboid protease GluP
MSWIRRLRDAPVTVALIAVNLLVFAAMVASSHRVVAFDPRTLIEAGSSVWAPNVEASHWRWLTAAFIHVGLPHIAMNMWVLAQIGGLSERALGRGLYAAAYVVTGTCGNVLSTTMAAHRGTPLNSAGASGAIMGLIGMAATFAWLTGQRPIARALAMNVVFVLGVGLSLSATGVNLVDNGAHIGGLVAGAALGAVRARVRTAPPRWLEALLITASFLVTAFGFGRILFLPE